MFTKKSLDRVRDSRFPAIFNRKLRILAEMLPYVIEHQGESIQAGCDAYKNAKAPKGDDEIHWNDNTANLLSSFDKLSVEELQFLSSFVERLEIAISGTKTQTRLNTGDLIDTEFEDFSRENGFGSMGYKNPHYTTHDIVALVWNHAESDASLF